MVDTNPQGGFSPDQIGYTGPDPSRFNPDGSVKPTYDMVGNQTNLPLYTTVNGVDIYTEPTNDPMWALYNGAMGQPRNPVAEATMEAYLTKYPSERAYHDAITRQSSSGSEGGFTSEKAARGDTVAQAAVLANPSAYYSGPAGSSTNPTTTNLPPLGQTKDWYSNGGVPLTTAQQIDRGQMMETTVTVPNDYIPFNSPEGMASSTVTEGPTNTLAALSDAYAQNRAGFASNLGDINTPNIAAELMRNNPSLLPYQATAYALQQQLTRAQGTPGIRDEQFFTGELARAGENLYERASEYHYIGQTLGIPVPSNPFEYQGDLAVEYLKGVPSGKNVFSPVSGSLAKDLPSGLGLQDYAWGMAKGNGSPMDFTNATEKVFVGAAGQYGPYGNLFGGPNYQGTSSSDGLRKQDAFQYTPAIQDTTIALLTKEGYSMAYDPISIGGGYGTTQSPRYLAPLTALPTSYDAATEETRGPLATNLGISQPNVSIIGAGNGNQIANSTFRSDPIAVALEGSVYLVDALSGLVSLGAWKPGADLIKEYKQNVNPTLDAFNSKMAGLQSQQVSHDTIGTKITSEKSDISRMISGKINSEGKFTGTPEEYTEYQSALGIMNSDVSKYNEFSTQHSNILAEGYKSGAIISAGNGAYIANPDNDRTYGAFSDWNRGVGRGIQSLFGETTLTASDFSALEQTPVFENANPVMQFGEGAYKVLATDPASLAQSATQALAIYVGLGALGVGAAALAPAEGVAAIGIPQTIGALGVGTLASPIFQYGTGALFVGIGAGEATGWGSLPRSQSISNLGGFSTHMAVMSWTGLATNGIARGYNFDGSSKNPIGILDRPSPIGIGTTKATGIDAATTILYAKVPFSASESGGYPVASVVRQSPIETTLGNPSAEISGDIFTNVATRIPSQQEAVIQANQAINAGPQTYIHATSDITPFMSKGSIDVSPNGEGGMFFSGQPGVVYENFLSGNLNGVREMGATGTPGIVRLTAQPTITPEYMAAINELQGTPISGRSPAGLGVATAKLPSGLYPGLTGYGGVEIPGRAVLSEMVVPGGSKLYVNKVSWEMTPSGEKIPAIDVSFESPGVVTRGKRVVQSILPSEGTTVTIGRQGLTNTLSGREITMGGLDTRPTDVPWNRADHIIYNDVVRNALPETQRNLYESVSPALNAAYNIKYTPTVREAYGEVPSEFASRTTMKGVISEAQKYQDLVAGGSRANRVWTGEGGVELPGSDVDLWVHQKDLPLLFEGITKAVSTEYPNVLTTRGTKLQVEKNRMFVSTKEGEEFLGAHTLEHFSDIAGDIHVKVPTIAGGEIGIPSPQSALAMKVAGFFGGIKYTPAGEITTTSPKYGTPVYPERVPTGQTSDWSGTPIDPALKLSKTFHHMDYEKNTGAWLTSEEHSAWHRMNNGEIPKDDAFYNRYQITTPNEMITQTSMGKAKAELVVTRAKDAPEMFALSRSIASDIYTQNPTVDFAGVRTSRRTAGADSLVALSENTRLYLDELKTQPGNEAVTKRYETIKGDVLKGVNRNPQPSIDIVTGRGWLDRPTRGYNEDAVFMPGRRYNPANAKATEEYPMNSKEYPESKKTSNIGVFGNYAETATPSIVSSYRANVRSVDYSPSSEPYPSTPLTVSTHYPSTKPITVDYAAKAYRGNDYPPTTIFTKITMDYKQTPQKHPDDKVVLDYPYNYPTGDTQYKPIITPVYPGRSQIKDYPQKTTPKKDYPNDIIPSKDYPADKPKPPAIPFGNFPNSGGNNNDKRRRRRKVELFSFEMGEDTPIPTRYGLAGKTTQYIPGTRGVAADILSSSDIAPNSILNTGRRNQEDRL